LEGRNGPVETIDDDDTSSTFRLPRPESEDTAESGGLSSPDDDEDCVAINRASGIFHADGTKELTVEHENERRDIIIAELRVARMLEYGFGRVSCVISNRI
jgi:hypothetical protein